MQIPECRSPNADPRRLTHNHARSGAVIGGWLSGIGWTGLETEEAGGELGVSGASRMEMAQDHRKDPHLGETASITSPESKGCSRLENLDGVAVD